MVRLPPENHSVFLWRCWKFVWCRPFTFSPFSIEVCACRNTLEFLHCLLKFVFFFCLSLQQFVLELHFSVMPENKSLFHTFFSWRFINNLVVDKQKFVKNLSRHIDCFSHLAFIWSVSIFHVFFHILTYMLHLYLSQNYVLRRGKKITFCFQLSSAYI